MRRRQLQISAVLRASALKYHGGSAGLGFNAESAEETQRTQRVRGWALRATLGNRLGEEPVFIMGICNYENEPL